jgi:hypothetical protein
MRVNYYFRDDMDTYKIEAEVYSSNRVQVLTIEDSFGTDIDIDDFSDNERDSLIRKALAARDNLEQSEEPDYEDASNEQEALERYDA